uniref:Tether containing UBX domain for GLUT4 n=1 Tax=Anthurium amnicola TaxID=1678845 RepID=A0A1D1YU07_9ARAE
MIGKRRRLLQSCDAMDADKAKAKLTAVAEEIGRQIRVFTIPTTSPTAHEPSAASTSQNEEEPDDEFYEFTPDDYYRIMSAKMGDMFLKTRKIRDAEAAARRARITKAIIRVRFPDSYVLEAKFHPSETIQSLMDLIIKVVARPDLPFYLYTTPPKERIKDMSKDFYSAGFAPGAIVYFSYDLPKEQDGQVGSPVPFLREDILSLNDLDLSSEKVDAVQPTTEPAKEEHPPAVPEPKAEKKPTKPKWFKM